jgi:hypothetical protein
MGVNGMIDDTIVERVYERLHTPDHSALLHMGRELTWKVLTGGAYSRIELATFGYGVTEICNEMGFVMDDKAHKALMGAIHYRLAQFWRE